VEAVSQLSTLSEATVLELVSAGKIADLFPFRPTVPKRLPADTIDESELVEASAMPLSRHQRDALVQSSMPSKAARASRQTAGNGPRSSKKVSSKG
jgi:hypothetical protein